MRGRTLLILGVITIAVAATAMLATYLRAPGSFAERELLFPDLAKHINDATQIRLEGGGRTVTLQRDDQAWGIQEADGYPALTERVKQLLVGVADLRVASEKTSSPELYGRLGVEDPSGKKAASTLLGIKDASGKPLADLIVGFRRRSAGPGGQPGLYVRLPGTPQALLVDGRLDTSTDLSDWFERQLFDVASSRVREIRIQHADGTVLRVIREEPGADLSVPDLPKGKDLQSDVVVSRLGTMLEGFFAEGVRGASRISFPDNAATVTVTTFDGLVANITAARIEDKPYALFAFSYDTAAAAAVPSAGATAGAATDAAEKPQTDVAAEAQQLQEAVAGWAFQIPQFKSELFDQRMEDLIRVGPREVTLPAEAEDFPPLPE